MLLQTLLADLGRITQVSGVNSGLYSLFTATFVGSGLAFIFLPELTKTGMFGSTPLSPEDLALWRVLGSTVAGVVAPIASIQQVCTASVFAGRLIFPHHAHMESCAVARVCQQL